MQQFSLHAKKTLKRVEASIDGDADVRKDRFLTSHTVSEYAKRSTVLSNAAVQKSLQLQRVPGETSTRDGNLYATRLGAAAQYWEALQSDLFDVLLYSTSH